MDTKDTNEPLLPPGTQGAQSTGSEAPPDQPSARPVAEWRLRTLSLTLGLRTLVMGIVNVTPDSFSGDGLHAGHGEPAAALDAAVERSLRLLDEGAAILDLGGESTRPGSGAGSPESISAQQEQDRVLPLVEALQRERPSAVLSVDTYRASTARAAAAAGVEIVNDVSGFLWDSEMAAVCAEVRCGLVLMHTRGRPDEWRSLPGIPGAEVAPSVLDALHDRLLEAQQAGIAAEQIVLDPGYGFGKAFDANYALLHGQARLLTLGRPLLAGVSRKSFLGRTLDGLRREQRPGHEASPVPPEQRDHATLAASVVAVLHGASVLRVHAVRPAVEAAAIADAVLAAGASR